MKQKIPSLPGMTLLIVRHAHAMDREISHRRGISEGDRPLTAEGKHRFKKTIKLLQSLNVNITMCFVSPWKRAQDTAKLLKRQVPVRHMITADWLLPDVPFSETHKNLVASILQKQKKKRGDVVAIVGHEPHLSPCLTSYLQLPVPWENDFLPEDSQFIKLKKGAVAEVTFVTSTPRTGEGLLQRLVWF